MPGTTGGAMRKVVRRLGLRRRALLALALAALLLPGADTVRLTPARAVALDYVFSVGRWEAANFADKWLHLLWEALPGNKPTREERLAVLDEYLLTARLVQKEEDRLEGRYLRRGTATALGSGGRELPGSREYLDELVKTREGLRASAEEATEAEISAVLEQEGLDSRLGLIFPPVDLRFGQPPTILITSPRDRIRVIGSLLLEPDLDVFERDRLEKELRRSTTSQPWSTTSPGSPPIPPSSPNCTRCVRCYRSGPTSGCTPTSSFVPWVGATGARRRW